MYENIKTKEELERLIERVLAMDWDKPQYMYDVLNDIVKFAREKFPDDCDDVVIR